MDTMDGILSLVGTFIEWVSAAILVLGFSKATYGFILSQLPAASTESGFDQLSKIRLQIGTYILLGLDFYIVSDIVHSMIRPELHELISLALIVVLRTTIGFFLSRELSEIERGKSIKTKPVE